jgi:flagellar biosynthesis activator protein FlaF
MNSSQAYEQIQSGALEGRELEASVLSRAARKLNRCVKNWDQRTTPQGMEEFRDALAFTQRLWTFLQVEVSSSDHLPTTIRTSVFRLSRYMDKTIIKLYSGGTLHELKSLVNINNEMAAALMSRGQSGGQSE